MKKRMWERDAHCSSYCWPPLSGECCVSCLEESRVSLPKAASPAPSPGVHPQHERFAGGCQGPSPAAGLWHSLDAAERRFSAFPSCSDWRNSNPSTFPPPPPRALCFSGIIFNLYQAPDLAARGTVRTAEWAQWEGWEQGDGERKERKDGGRTAEANTFAEANV